MHSFHIKYNVDTSTDQSEASAKLDLVTTFDVAILLLNSTCTPFHPRSHLPLYVHSKKNNIQRNGIAV
jgi:hypothetical protein